MSRSDREYERHATVLAVRFASAAEFVVEYAENLSVGGLFVRQAQDLEPLTLVTVQIDLAGFDTFEVKAKVAHIMDEAMASKLGRTPGAGLQLIEVPPGFEKALSTYLSRLGRRRDFLILAEEEACVAMLSEAGFWVESTNAGRVVEQSLGERTVLAAVVSKGAASSFRDALSIAPMQIPVIGCHCAVDEEPLLAELDRLVVSR